MQRPRVPLGPWGRRARLSPGVRNHPTFTIELDYPVEPAARHGWGRPPHPQLMARIEANRERIQSTLAMFLGFAEPLGRIPLVVTSETGPFWNNHWFQGLDVVALYSLLAHRNPRRCVEIGSGHSTRVARQSVTDSLLRTELVSIDPQPRSPVSSIADQHISTPLQDIDLSIFDSLSSGDFVLFDGSHRAFTNSDVTIFFTEVLPRLASGVLVQVHDIFLPWDYRPDWADRWYSEQYLLAAWLLGGQRLEIVMPNFYVSTKPDLHSSLAPIWNELASAGTPNLEHPSAFWFEMRDDPVT